MADGRGADYINRKTPEEVARILASAAGHMDSCAMYLYQTVMKLEEHGIHRRRLWHLQSWWRANIQRMSESSDPR